REQRQVREEAQKVADQTRRMERVALELARSLSPQQVGDVVVEHGGVELGAQDGGVWVLTPEGDWIERLSPKDSPRGPAEQPAPAPLHGPSACRCGGGSGEPAGMGGGGGSAPPSPGGARSWGERPNGALVCLPLRVEARDIGALTFSFEAPRRFDDAD